MNAMTDFHSGQAAVELLQVSHVYTSKHHSVAALADVSIGFRTGTWTAVMGPSGSGKSTLMHCAGGLERPTSGRVIVSGCDITDANDRALTALRRTTIGFVFQNFNLIGSLSAEQNVAMPLRLAGQRPRRSEVRAVLDRVGLADRRGHRPRELSGGQQQRVAIARAMVTRPAVLLADEPTGALDSNTSRALLAMMRAMVVDQQQTIVMVTHDPMVAAAADRVLFLNDGRMVDEISAPTAPAVADRLARLEADPAALAG
jgi:putative ABC transport system ATP-binding protein